MIAPTTTVSTNDAGLRFAPLPTASAAYDSEWLTDKWTRGLSSLLHSYPRPDTGPAAEASNAFYELDQKEQSDRKKIVREIERLDIPCGGRIAKRLSKLMSAAEEVYPEEPLLSLRSLKDLRVFLGITRHEWGYPELGLSPGGNIMMDWYYSKTNHLTIELRGDGMAKFVLFTPDIHKKKKTVPVSAIASIESIEKALEPYAVWEWVKYAG